MVKNSKCVYKSQILNATKGIGISEINGFRNKYTLFTNKKLTEQTIKGYSIFLEGRTKLGWYYKIFRQHFPVR